MEEDPFKNTLEMLSASDSISDPVEPTNENSTPKQDCIDNEGYDDEDPHVQDEAKIKELITSMEHDTMLREPFAERVQAFVDKSRTNKEDLYLTRLSCFNVKTNCFRLKNLISLVRLK